jgi:hypothetical protein
MKQSTYLEEEIKGRMLRHMAALWGVKNTDALDPLVKLLVEVMTGEMQKTYHEIHDFENRVLGKIASLMTPGHLSAPYCAHAIAYAQPVEESLVLAQHHHFVFKKKSQNEKEGLLDVFFTPVDDIQLVNGNVKYVVTGNRGFAMDENLQKSIVLNGNAQSPPTSTIWLGVEMGEKTRGIDHLHFYFDFKNTENKQPLFSILQNSAWEIDKHPISTVKGLLFENRKESDKEEAVFSDYDPMLVIEKEIKQLYHSQFITIVDKKGQLALQDVKQNYPAEFGQVFNHSELAKFNEKLLWIKITPPTTIEEKKLFDLFVCMNAVPVINRGLKEVVHRFKGLTNIIPIHTDYFEYFVAVKSLMDAENRVYKQIPFVQQETMETSTYYVRKSGTERIDSRSAKEYLSYLVELIRDESVAFSSYGQDTVGNLLKEADKLMAQIEQRVKMNKESHSDFYHYVTLEFKGQQESVFFRYWITNSGYANAIHAGSRLLPYKGSEVKSKSVLLLTTTRGGKKPMDAARHMDAYKYSLLTHNRILTIEDIRAFCLHELGDKIEKLEIRKGMMQSSRPKEGLVRCVDILLSKKTQGASRWLGEDEWSLLIQETKSKIEMLSALNLQYQFLFVE